MEKIFDEFKKDRVVKKFKTDIPGFDYLLKEGVPIGASVLVEGGPGSGKTIFCLQIAYNALWVYQKVSGHIIIGRMG